MCLHCSHINSIFLFLSHSFAHKQTQTFEYSIFCRLIAYICYVYTYVYMYMHIAFCTHTYCTIRYRHHLCDATFRIYRFMKIIDSLLALVPLKIKKNISLHYEFKSSTYIDTQSHIYIYTYFADTKILCEYIFI